MKNKKTTSLISAITSSIPTLALVLACLDNLLTGVPINPLRSVIYVLALISLVGTIFIWLSYSKSKQKK